MGRDTNNQRKYIRLRTSFPVKFQFVDTKKRPISSIYEGFTRDVGKGGMLVEAKAVSGLEFISNETKLRLVIGIPSDFIPTESYATVRWSKIKQEGALTDYLFGVEYDQMDSDNQKMIERHVQWLYRRPRLIFVFLLLFLLWLSVLLYLSIRPQ